jgi:hypothetical protein
MEDNLPRNERDTLSPEWHGAVLEERERKIASGEDTFLEWKEVKRHLQLKLGMRFKRRLT